MVALAVRLYQLDGRSLWLDEILTSQTAHLSGPAQVVAWSQAAINQMPFFYMFTWFLGRWGDGPVILRLPAVVAGTLLVPAVFLLGRALYGTRTGLVAALLMALLPFAVWYSQEARNYALLMLVTTLQMYFAFKAVKRGGIWDWLGLTVFTVLNLYTHYVAIAVTAAAGVYVLVFVLADLLRGSSLRVKVATGAVVAAAGAAAFLLRRRSVLQSAYDFVHRHAPGHGAELIAITAVGFVVVAALALTLSSSLRKLAVAPRFRRLELALAAGFLVALAYLPWLPSLVVFLGRPDQSLGQIHLDHPAGLSDLAYTLASLDVTGVMLVGLGVGLVAVVGWAFADKAAESVLLLAWLAVPLGIIAATAGRNTLAVDTRYVAFLLPAAMITIGAGVEALALGVQHLATRAARRGAGGLAGRAGAITAIAALLLLLMQTVPALASSYGQPKNDYRAVAERIAAASRPGSAVISVGDYSDWTVICLQYYFRQLNAPIAVVDGRQVDRAVVDRLTSGSGEVWGVVIFPSRDQLSLLSSPGAEKVDFVDVTREIYVVKPSDPGLSPRAQAVALLQWELPLQPALGASLFRIGGYSAS